MAHPILNRYSPIDGQPSVVRRVAIFAMLSCCLLSPALLAQSASADAPTTGKSAEAIDQEWQQAVSKYDANRQEILAKVHKIGEAGPFVPDWQSLAHYEAPEWYRDAKFGIFIHWGVYSVPAYGNEWYPREMYQQGSDINKHQVATYGPLDKFGYKDFIPMFKAEKFDPQAWAKLFNDAGARYVVPVFEHHDGFAMYDSDLSDWTAKKMGPHQDLAGEVAAAVRAQGLHLGASFHRVEHDWFLDEGRKEVSDVNDPKYAGFYGPAHARSYENNNSDVLSTDWTYVSPQYAQDWLARVSEIVDKYHPELIYFDWWIGQPSIRPYLADLAAYYYNESSRRGTIGIINYKYSAMAPHSAVFDIERGQAQSILPQVWQTDTSVSNTSWGYIEHDTFKSPEFIIQLLADVVSKNGNLLLNIGPRSDGTIPNEVQQVLLSIGGWLKVNGDAIYETRPWTTFGEGPTQVQAGSFHDTDTAGYTPKDFRFTTKAGRLYAIQMACPKETEATIDTLRSSIAGTSPIKSVELLGSSTPLTFEQKADGLHLHLVADTSCKYAAAYRITFEGTGQ